MAGLMKTPGVYIVEKNAFPSSVVEVATAVPAFIGYTEKAENKGKSLSNKPWRISSMVEYIHYFGGGPEISYKISAPAAISPDGNEEPLTFTFDNEQFTLTREGPAYLLYHAMRLFFANGGGPCYIVSVGSTRRNEPFNKQKFLDGIALLVKEQEPTMVVIPEAIRLTVAECRDVQVESLNHCGFKMKNRFAILDIPNGSKDRTDGDPVGVFRNNIGANFLSYGAAYYPWLNTSVVQNAEVTYETIHPDSRAALQNLISKEMTKAEFASVPDTAKEKELLAGITKADLGPTDRELIASGLWAKSELMQTIIREIRDDLNLLPPSAAMAGVYTMVDSVRGVWKAPANVSLAAVNAPAVNITHDDQEELNVHPQGRSVNAIRSFVGEGVLVWGARTLDGNSLDWRYINVRRTILMLEESIRLATKSYVFENNTANTWVTIKGMIRNFLTGIWKRGGLAGATPDDAFSVYVGLGETMTPEDILEGVLKVTVLVALIRPAEFIEITFQQQMQKS